MYQITEQLFVGNIYETAQPPAQIGALLFVAEEYEIDLPQWLATGRIPLKEYGKADAGQLADAVAWIEGHVKESRVLVCCRAGMGRSVSVVMAYLCCIEGMSYADIVQLIMLRRPGAMPLPQLEEAIQTVKRMRQADRGHPPA